MIDNWSRHSSVLEAGFRMSGLSVAAVLDRVLGDGPESRSITVGYGMEFQSRALEGWAYRCGVQLDFIRLGRPVGNTCSESFDGRLCDKCLNWCGLITMSTGRTALLGT